MGVILFGGGIVDHRGSVAGNTFSRNGAGAIHKTRIKGLNPQTSLQDAPRLAIHKCNVSWKKDLTNSDRTAWATFAASNPTLNKLGQVITLSGFQMFTKLNSTVFLSNGSVQITPPVSTSVHMPLTFSIDADSSAGGALHVTFTSNGVTAPEVMFIWLTGPLSQGRTFYSSQLRRVAGHSTDGTWDVKTAWKGYFGSLPSGAGQLIGGRIQVVNTATGIVSTSLAATSNWI